MAFAATEFGRHFLRPWVRSSGLNDFGLTDCIGNLGGIVVMIFFGCAAMNPTRKQSFRLAAFYSLGFVAYEFVQPYLPKGVFDWLDVLGTAIGYLISLALLSFIWRLMKNLACGQQAPDSDDGAVEPPAIGPNTSFQRARVRGDRGLGPLNSKR